MRLSPTALRLAPAISVALALLQGCSDDPASASDAGATTDVSTDLGRDGAVSADRPGADVPTGPTADRRRVPVGSTFYLPAGDWALATNVTANMNAIFRDTAGRSAFVAHVPGDYRFTEAAGTTVSVTFVDPASLAFHNLDYYPTRAVATLGDLAFVASVLRPEVVAVNPADFTSPFTVPVGAWPVAIAALTQRNLLLVAARGEDTLTVVDVAARRPSRSVWIGDEVSNVVVTPDGATAIALLPHDRKVVFINTMDWSELGRVDVGSDPHHIAVRADGSTVFVAGRRTGLGAMTEAGDPAGADVSEISVATRAVVRTIHRVGTTLGGIALAPDGNSLFVATLRNDPSAPATTELSPRFQHMLVRYDLSGAGAREAAAVDLSRSRPGAVVPVGDAGVATDAGAMSDAGADAAIVDAGVTDSGVAPTGLDDRRVVGLQWVGVRDGSVWVVSEATDLVLRLDAASLVEQERFAAPGRPRAAIFTNDGTVLAFGHQTQQLTVVGAGGGAARSSMALGRDPRSAAVARGQAYFTGPGMRAELGAGQVLAGDVMSCSSCHADGLTDGIVWPTGPIAGRQSLSRALTLPEATAPLGWQGGYGALSNAVFAVNIKVGVMRPTQEQVDGLAAYLASMATPPAANTLTGRDGSLSEEAARGAVHFQASCASCHEGSLTTNRARVERDVGGGPFADVASLLGTARLGAWFPSGAQRTLAGAVGAWVDETRAPLNAVQRAELTRYVAELTGRDFYVTTEVPRATERIATTSPITLVFSQPVLDRPENLARIGFNDPSGRPLGARVVVEGRRLTITPTSPLLFGGEYHVVIGEGFESEQEVRTARAQDIVFRTVVQPTLRMSGAYTLTYAPAPGASASTMPSTLSLTLSSDGGGLVSVVASFAGAPLTWHGTGTVSGRRLHLPAMPLPVGTTFADAPTGFDGDLGDTDGDGTGDFITTGASDGGVRGYTMAGPGFEARDLAWNLTRSP